MTRACENAFFQVLKERLVVRVFFLCCVQEKRQIFPDICVADVAVAL